MADKSYKDRLLDLRKQLTESTRLGLVNPELFQQQLIQMLNGVESIKIKSQSEIERLTNLIGEERGRVKACNDMGDLIVNIISAFVNQEHNRLLEEVRTNEESEERAAYAASQAVAEITVSLAEAPKVLPPGVNLIKGTSEAPAKKSKKLTNA